MIELHSVISDTLKEKKLKDSGNTKTSGSDPFTLGLSTNFSLATFKLHKKCSYYEYGKYEFYQKVSYCEVCDPNNKEMICLYCLTTCHRNCSKECAIKLEEEDVKEGNISRPRDVNEKFICTCGEKKHEVQKKNDIVLERKCFFLDIDIHLHNKAVYACKMCKCNTLCFICYLHCHGNTKTCNHVKQVTEDESANFGRVCDCTHANHGSIVVMNHFVNLNFLVERTNNYDTLPFVWKQQILNSIFDSNMYKNLFSSIDSFIQSGFEVKRINDIVTDTMARVVTNINKSSMFYYFHPNLVSMLPLGMIISITSGIKGRNLVVHGNFLTGAIGILLYVHLKKDFQKIKGLCVYDYLVCSTLDRIALRMFMHTNSIYTREIHEKYFIRSKRKFSLVKICLNLMRLLEKACSEYPEDKFRQCAENNFYIFRIVFFVLKRMMFDLKSLLKLIETFEKFTIALYRFMTNAKEENEISISNKKLEKEEENRLEIPEFLNNVIAYLSKITFLITVNYNDLIVHEYLFQNENKCPCSDKKKDITQEFIHYSSEHSKKLFKLIISTSLVYGIYRMSNNIESHVKQLNFLIENIEIFTRSENVYFRHLNQIKYKDLSSFSRRYTKISELTLWENNHGLTFEIISQLKGLNKVDFDEFRKMSVSYDENTAEGFFKKIIFNLKESAENSFQLFFFNKINIEQLGECLIEMIDDFMDKHVILEEIKIKNRRDTILHSLKLDERSNKNMNASSTKSNDATTSLIYHSLNQSSLETYHKRLFNEIKLKKFTRKIIQTSKEKFKIFKVNDFSDFNENRIICLIDELIFSSLDTTLTKYFFMDYELKRYNEKTVSMIYDILTLYCLNKDSISFFCTGRNFRRIVKMIPIFPLITIKFLYYIFKAIYLNEIDFSYHDRLPLVMSTIYEHIIKNVKVLKEDADFKKCITYTMKILKFLSPHLDFDQLSEIKSMIFNFVEKRNLFDRDRIIKIFRTGKSYTNNETSPPDKICVNISNGFPPEIYKNNESPTEFYKTQEIIELKPLREAFDQERKKNKNKLPNVQQILSWGHRNEKKIKENIMERVSMHNLSNDSSGLLDDMESNRDLLNENYHNRNDQTAELPHVQKASLEQKFFFSFIHLFSNLTHFFVEEENLSSMINKLNDLDFYKFLLGQHLLTLKHRTSLLSFIRTSYLSDLIEQKTFSLVKTKYFSSYEYSKYLWKMRELFNDENATVFPIQELQIEKEKNIQRREKFRNLKEKKVFEGMEGLNNLKLVIEIFIQELENFLVCIYMEPEDIYDVDVYVRSLLYSVKFIFDVFIIYDIASHLTLWFYDLAREFLKKAEVFKEYINHVKLHSKIEGMIIPDYFSNHVLELEKPQFDIFNKDMIYSYVLETFQEIFQETDLNWDFKLSTFLIKYKISDEMDFKTFSLNHMEKEYDYLLSDSDFTGPFVASKLSFRDAKANERKNKSLSVFLSKVNTEVIQMITDSSKRVRFQMLQKAKEAYLKQFVNTYSTTFIDIICSNSYDLTIDYKKIFFQFGISYIFNLNKLSSDNLVALLTILNKLLIFNSENSQKAILDILKEKNMTNTDITTGNSLNNNNLIIKEGTNGVLYEEIFFQNIVAKLEQKLNMNMITCKNFLISDRYQKINMATKTIIQFIQLLGEGHNKAFQSLIINGLIDKDKDNDNNPKEKNKKDSSGKALSVLCVALKSAMQSINFHCKGSITIKGEMPSDKLIVVIHNITDCVTEFFQGSNIENYKVMYSSVKNVFCYMKSFIFYKENTNNISNSIEENNNSEKENPYFNTRRKFILLLKIILMELIIALIEEGNADNPEINTLTEIMMTFNPIDLYSEIVSCIESLYMKFRNKIPRNITLDEVEAIPYLMKLYTFDEDFHESIELKLALKIYYFLKILSDVYNRIEVINFLGSFVSTYTKAKADENVKKRKNFRHTFTIVPAQAKMSFNKLARYSNNITPISKVSEKNSLQSQSNFGNIRSLSHSAYFTSSKKKNKKSSNKKYYYTVNEFLCQLMKKIEIRCKENGSLKDFSFFVIPPICFLLSKQTMERFTDTVDRDSVYSKVCTLISETDYFIYEMMYNYNLMRKFSKVNNFFNNINLYYWEIINYIIIVAQNGLLLYYFYSTSEIEDKVKYQVETGNLVVSIVQLGYLSFILIIWFKYQFRLYYKHKIMMLYNEKFIFRSSEADHSYAAKLSEFQETYKDNLGGKLTFRAKFKVALCDAILFNREINIFVFTYITLILYLITGSTLCLVIPTMFVANLNNILFGIVLAVRLRWGQLIAVLIYTYLIVYFFSWISFYYLTQSFSFDSSVDMSTGLQVTEKMCSSAIQCYMTHLDYGVRSGGGIGDVLPKISYNTSTGYFIGKFFYDIIFHISVIWIMSNLFFGIIVDTFAALRDRASQILNDREKVCFICQMTRDTAMHRYMDFEQHRNTVHNMWNYVYFLTYLHINNENDFKSLETFVWNKIHKMDTSWVPICEIEIEEPKK